MKTIKTGAGALALILAAANATAAQSHVYESGGVSYPYTTEETGENHTFEFKNNPGKEGSRLRAALHVFRMVYGDDSIEQKYSQVYLKEGATCYVFDGRYYTYRTCFLPNDYSPDKQDRFWGFVSRLPNFMWFVTRQGLPALMLAGAAFYFLRRRQV